MLTIMENLLLMKVALLAEGVDRNTKVFPIEHGKT